MSQAIIPATLDKITTLKDGGVKIIFDSQEINAQQGADLMALRNKFGTLFFGDLSLDSSVEPIKAPPTDKTSGKSASQRLRAAIFREWEAYHSKLFDSESYYQYRMKQIIGSIIEKLPSPFRE